MQSFPFAGALLYGTSFLVALALGVRRTRQTASNKVISDSWWYILVLAFLVSRAVWEATWAAENRTTRNWLIPHRLGSGICYALFYSSCLRGLADPYAVLISAPTTIHQQPEGGEDQILNEAKRQARRFANVGGLLWSAFCCIWAIKTAMSNERISTTDAYDFEKMATSAMSMLLLTILAALLVTAWGRRDWPWPILVGAMVLAMTSCCLRVAFYLTEIGSSIHSNSVEGPWIIGGYWLPELVTVGCLALLSHITAAESRALSCGMGHRSLRASPLLQSQPAPMHIGTLHASPLPPAQPVPVHIV